MKGILMLIISLIMSGCFSYKQISNEDIFGKYVYRGVYGVSSEIELRNDGTFIYSWQEGLNAGATKGNWKRDTNTLILNSEKQSDEIINARYEVSEEKKNEQKGITIKVIDENNNPVHFAACLIQVNDEEKIGKSSNENGICFFDKEIAMINKISITYAGYYLVEHNPNKASNNYFMIMIKKEEPPYVVFANQQWQIKFSTRSKCLVDGERRYCKTP